MAQIHIIGAGLAGLACAVDLIDQAPITKGHRICLYEAAPQAGGRCRSFFDTHLGCLIDNGNHLVLSGNHALWHYLKMIGAQDRLFDPGKALFPFIDVQTGKQWALHLNKGVIPWWFLIPKRRVAGTKIRDYFSILRLLTTNHNDTIAHCLSSSDILYRRFWVPLTLAVLNAAPQEAAAMAMKQVFLETLARGAEYCRPLVACDGLGPSFIDPAIDWLRRSKSEIFLSTRVQRLHFEGTRVVQIDLGHQNIPLQSNDCVVLAVPMAVARQMVPGLITPEGHRAIVNVHFRLDSCPVLPERMRMIGLINSKSQWLFVRGCVVSITISAACEMLTMSAEQIATTVWQEVVTVLDLTSLDMPRYRVVKEQRATFAQTPENLTRRPQSRTCWSNLFLAGDWTDTGIPATIEGAVRSGFTAAKEVSALLAGVTS